MPPLLFALLALLHTQLAWGFGAMKPVLPSTPVSTVATFIALCLLAPLLAYALQALWNNPEVPIVARLLWARAKEAVGVRVSSRKLTAELVAVSRRYAKQPAGGAAGAEGGSSAGGSLGKRQAW
jgi:hypothetical protein